MKGLSAAFAATCAFAAITAVASVGSRTGYSFYGGTQNDTIPTAGKMLPGEVAQDTTAFKGKPYEGSDIMLTARAYGDRIVLRWAPSDYAAWMRLNLIGYNIYRWDEKNHCDTLALALKPKTLEEFRAKYAPNDSVATIGYGLIYGDNLKKPTETREEPGSYGSMLEMYDDQVTSLAFAVLASEWRQDVAEDMAMRFVDRNVRKGARYTYLIQPARRFKNDNMFIKGKELSKVENKPYVPQPYNVGLKDSITGQLAVTLYWTDKHNSSFEIERRVAGTQEWRRVNSKPYMPMYKQDLDDKDEEVMYVDNVPQPGTYEYRVMAHDAFGDTTAPSETLTVKVGDMKPPKGPTITLVNIDRPDETDPTKQIFATISWEKDTVEADLAGFLPLYYNERFTGNDWKPLCEKTLPADAREVKVDVTGLSTGMLVMAAYDEAGNVGYSPQPGTYEYRVMAHDAFGDTTAPSETLTVKVGDMKPPKGPTITLVNIDRPDETDPTKQIFATISWEKDTVEADLAGFLPLYYNERFTGNDWKPLCEKTLPADAREVKVDVTGLSTGMLVMAAYDEAGNVGYSMPVQLRISDMKAPDAPANLRAEVSADDGTITLRWDKPADDDVAYYELAYANDTTHHFLMRNQGQLKDTMFVDTVQMTVNQRFIYYKVRAVDYSNNTGEFSPILQVERPHITPPTQPHLDSAWVDNSGIHMDWVTGLDADMYYHRIYRRLENSSTWDLIAIVTAEDVLKASPDGVIHLTDKPQTNNTYYYEYMVVSFNRSEIASEPSLIFSARFADFTEAELGIKAVGTYDPVKDEARLSWEHKAVDGKQTPYYYCVYRKGKDEADYTFLCSTEPDMPLHTDHLLSPGESASYYVVVRFTDGRRSQPSNKVTITAPAKAPSKAK